MMNKLQLITIILTSMSVLTACGVDKNKVANNKHEHQDQTDSSEYKKDKQKKMAEQLSSHYARLASKHTDSCPKLLQKQIDSQLITRRKEQLKGQYCDYYIYPKKGELLTITSSDPALKITLRMPRTHDFANGAYLVDSNRRHVIRVAYAGSTYKPSDFIYNIKIQLDEKE